MSIRHVCAGLSGLALTLVPLSGTTAHEIVGNRFFPATLGIDDPGVNDELSLPTVDSFNTGDNPPVRQRDISAEFSKRITDLLLLLRRSFHHWVIFNAAETMVVGKFYLINKIITRAVFEHAIMRCIIQMKWFVASNNIFFV